MYSLRLGLRASSAFVLFAGAACTASAQSLEETAARFGLLENVQDISLSPSGNKLAFISPTRSGGEIINVIDLDGDMKVRRILGNEEQHATISDCSWATDDRLVCTMVSSATTSGQGLLISFSRVFSVSASGGDEVLLTRRTSMDSLGFRQDGGDVIALDLPDQDNAVLMTSEYVPEDTMGTRLSNPSKGLGVDRVDVNNGRRRVIERPDEDAIAYFADENGVIRMKARQPSGTGGLLRDKVLYFYREPGESKWEPFSEVSVDAQSRTGFVPRAVDSQRNVAIGFATVNGFDAIVEKQLVAGSEAKVLLARNDVDVDSLIRIGRQRRVVGASFATEKRSIEYFDPDLSRLAANLQKALPNTPLVNIVGASADESKLLIVAASDTDPGTVYRYDRTSRELNELLPVRDFMADVPLGTMKPVSFPASDGTMIPGYLTLPPGSDGKNLPSIVLPHGGPSARDEWGFDWLVQFFVARGYAVLQPNYRGSSGYGEAWYGRNGFQAWPTAIGDVNDAGKWLVAEGIAVPERLAIVGWSYGGYAALQSQVVDSDLFKAVVAIAPVTDLEFLRQNSVGFTNYSLVDAFIGRGAHVKSGSPAQHAASFRAPVLLFHGTLDQNVDVGHSRLMEDRLRDASKPVEYVEFEGEAHSLENSMVRVDMLKRIDGFLASAMAN